MKDKVRVVGRAERACVVDGENVSGREDGVVDANIGKQAIRIKSRLRVSDSQRHGSANILRTNRRFLVTP